MLAAYRVLEVSNRAGWLAGRLLADLGADVIKVEPPGPISREPTGKPTMSTSACCGSTLQALTGNWRSIGCLRASTS
jgi:crotonobetainyl-CoA:carnitine CoA-transferase CaiB-like acyl-CoA transferase